MSALNLIRLEDRDKQSKRDKQGAGQPALPDACDDVFGQHDETRAFAMDKSGLIFLGMRVFGEECQFVRVCFACIW